MSKFKKISCMFVVALVIVFTVQSVFAGNFMTNAISWLTGSNQSITVKLDGNIINFPDTQSYVNEDNRTMVPVRFVSEALGCEVKWEEANQMVIVTKGPKRILLQIGQNWAIVNDTKLDARKELDTKTVLKDDRTMVPLRFVSEALGEEVTWDEENNTVVLKSESKTK